MKPMLAAVAAQAQVATIVPHGSRATRNVTTVDVTDLLLGQLQADADTRQTAEFLRDLKKTHPMKYRLYMFLVPIRRVTEPAGLRGKEDCNDNESWLRRRPMEGLWRWCWRRCWLAAGWRRRKKQSERAAPGVGMRWRH